MSNLYFNLKVHKVVQETDEAVTLVFETNQEPLSYKSGQFLTLIVDIEGKKVRRSYSLCSADGIDEYPAVTVKRVSGGLVSNYLADNIKQGDVIEVMQPMGTFCPELDYHKKRDVVLLGAGSGITPLMSIAKSVLAKEPLSSVYLLYGNRNEDSIIFKDKLDEMVKEHEGRFKVVHVLSQPKDTSYKPAGRLNRSLIIKLLESYEGLDMKRADYFICGPEGMMEEAQQALTLLEVAKDKVHQESFVSSDAKEPAGEVVELEQGSAQDVTIFYQGTEYKITVPPEKSILEVALEEDIDLPYSCQSGLCTACLGKCISGKVNLQDSDALSDKELEQGYVLTCVGHPVTRNVVIEID
ncbi:ferredoxin--NADP reductase [Cytophagaceae bacterium ABcell3]|nr:ferredoxin--NADP reductase [Cytophagaceae bacterium ABcell3]